MKQNKFQRKRNEFLNSLGVEDQEHRSRHFVRQWQERQGYGPRQGSGSLAIGCICIIIAISLLFWYLYASN